jgi:hypothetical protein
MMARMDSANVLAKQFGASIKKILIGHPASIVNYESK